MEASSFPKTLLKGFGQVMFQNSELTGFLFLIGIFYNSWLLGIAALLGVISSTLFALFLHYEKKDIEDGLYGFNGVLVGIALFFFFQPTLPLALLAILGAFLSTLIMKFMREKNLFPYTFPFVLSTWILMLLINALTLVPVQQQAQASAASIDLLSSISMGFGQVMFQASTVTGIVFFIAIFLNSRKSALYALFGSTAGMLVAFVLSFPLTLVNAGIFGFNAVLCGIALSGNKKAPLWAGISILLSVFIIYLMSLYNFAALTSPFVFATWITLALQRFAGNK